MTHRNAPLTPQGRLRLVQRCQHRPIAHIASEAGVSRQCLGKWVARYREHGEAGLHDHSSAPARRPTQTPPAVVDQIAAMRGKKWSARRITRELTDQGVRISVATVTRWLHRLGLNRLDHLDVDGEPLRKPGKITARWPGHMIHIDINSGQARAAAQQPRRRRSAVLGLATSTCTPPWTGSCSEPAWFRAHGVTRFTRIVTDNGSCYRAKDFTRAVCSFASRHQRTRPYTPRHNVHYNYHRPHSAAGDQPPASRLRYGVTNVMSNYS